ncbi:MAG: caspase family protein [Nitrospinota bacterium]|nr:caspase family protein [Nitrospinota bacterium]
MRYRRSILLAALASLLLASPLFAQTPARGKRLYANSWALVVGINRYRSSKIPQLEYAEADAQAMAKSLGRLGFPKGNVRLLLGPKATRDEVIRVLEEDLNPKMGENDRLFLYFSGHGASTKIHGVQAGYLLTHDALVFDWPSREKPFMSRAPVLVREGGTIPVVGALQDVLGLDSLLVPFGGHDDRTHSPNERMPLECVHRGIQTAGRLLDELSRI